MGSKSRVRIDQGKLRQLTRAKITALEKTAEALHTEIVQTQVIPRDTGALQNESTFVDYSKSAQGSCAIVSSTPYARRLYYHPEYNFNTEENPNARGKWFEPWMKGGMYQSHARNTFKKFYRKEAGL